MKTERLALIDPHPALRDEFLTMIEEYRQAGEWYNIHTGAEEDFEAYVESLSVMAADDRITKGRVPMNAYWLVQNDTIILAESRLRHFLLPHLEKEGGHIGYNVRPSARRQGYGSILLSLTLDRARYLGLRRVLVTCDADNTASARIIQKNGGHLSGQTISEISGKPVLQYWIDLY